MVNHEAFLLEYSERTWGTGHALALGRDSAGKSSYDHILENIAKPFAGQVLDVGCGDGFLLQQFLTNVAPRAKAFGIDMSQTEVERATARLQGTEAQIIVGRAQHLPLASASMDFVFCHLSLSVMSNIDLVLKEIQRVLRPGGQLRATVPGKFVRSSLFNNYLQALDESLKSEGKVWLSNLGDPRVRNEHGLQSVLKTAGFRAPFVIKNFELQFHLPPDELVELFLLKYDVAQLSPDSKEQLRTKVLRLLSGQKDRTGRVRHFAALRQIEATKPHDL
jgi:ubiquinone/menaquinone biosynthesis C-methylase UbiE